MAQLNSPTTHAHATLSPSGFKKTANCPGHLYLSRGIKEAESSFATEGTIYHEHVDFFSSHLDWWTQDLHKKVFERVAPYKEGDDEQAYKLSSEYEMAEYVCAALDLRKQLEEFLSSDRISLVKPKRFIEQRVKLSDAIWGTLDYGFAVKRDLGWEAVILDEKYGKGVPVKFDEFIYKDVALNYQLAIYALGFYFFLKQEHGIELNYVYMYIHQPRVGREAWEAAHCSIELLLDWYENVVKPAEQRGLACFKSIERPADTMFAAGSWCKSGFCKARAICPTYKDFTEKALLTQVDLDDLPLPAAPTLTVEQLVNIYRNKGAIIDFVGKVEEYLHQQLEEGVAIPGLKLKKKYGRASWKLSDEELVEALKEVGIDNPYKPTVPTLLGITDIKKLAGKEHKKYIESLTEKPLKGTEITFAEESETLAENVLGELL